MVSGILVNLNMVFCMVKELPPIQMVINMMVAGFSGVALPVLLDRLKIDPAIASGVFVTTVTDVVGFLSFLGLASATLL